MGKTCRTCEHQRGGVCFELVSNRAQRAPSDKNRSCNVIPDDDCVAFYNKKSGAVMIGTPAYSPIRPIPRL